MQKRNTEYQFKENRYLPPEVRRVGPQVVGEAIEAVTNGAGVVDKKKLIRAAKPEEAPLHPCFEWDDAKAAVQYRDVQARNIVNCVTVTVEGHSMPAFPTIVTCVTDAERPARENIRIIEVLSDAEMRSSMIAEVVGKLNSLRRQYQSLSELEVVWRAVDQVAVEA